MAGTRRNADPLLQDLGLVGKYFAVLFLCIVVLANISEGIPVRPPVICLTASACPSPPSPFQPPVLLFVIQFPILTIILLVVSILAGVIGAWATRRRILLFLPLLTASLIALASLIVFGSSPFVQYG